MVVMAHLYQLPVLDVHSKSGHPSLLDDPYHKNIMELQFI